MATNLALDDRLVDEAKRLGKHRTKRAAVNEALRSAQSLAQSRLGALTGGLGLPGL